ncbi:hypothetical protein SAMN05421813_10521 [Daejeonella rubra]|uniref:Helix-turn-helix n=1 Tax=Daejeonella rubra TaxID=990371 RepID=A0A1G9PX68_9SPHI|nr:helix-turn-helix domain-containing protein [Daejeonella rubra]SDM03366.1 hypothetical protein SAMN05421813_10521 [Daejeonella rubra]
MEKTETRGRKKIRLNYYLCFWVTGEQRARLLTRAEDKQVLVDRVAQMIEDGIEISKYYISNSKEFLEFLSFRPSLTISALAKEAGIPRSSLHQIVSGKLNMTEAYAEKLAPVLSRYGTKVNSKDIMRGATELKARKK